MTPLESLVAFAKGKIAQWSVNATDTLRLIDQASSALVSVNNGIVSLDAFYLSYDVGLPQHGIPGGILTSRFIDVTTYLRANFAEEFSSCEVFALEWDDLCEIENPSHSRLLRYKSNSFRVGDAQALENSSLYDDTVARPFFCVGKAKGCTDENPLSGTIFVAFEAYDGDVLVFFHVDSGN